MENSFRETATEKPRNAEQKCLCVLCLDISGSMSDEPIQSLNEGLKEFASEIKKDSVARKRLELSIVTFNDEVNVIQEPDLVDFFTMPTLEAGGSTKLVDGVREAIRKVEERKGYYKNNGLNYYRPFIILMTDGEPDHDQDLNSLAKEIRQGVEEKRFTFWAVGSQDYNHDKLASICHPKYPPKPLQGLKYVEFFQWLSASMKSVSKSSQDEKFSPPSTDSWELSDLSSNPTQNPVH